jgi:hypothetical protein
MARGPARIEWRRVGLLAAAKAVFALATADVLGLHRDVYYYLASGRHLQWGYVDNPPLVPWIYRAVDESLGRSQIALGVVPALCGAGYVLLAAALAAEVGGGRRAQLLASLVAMLGPLYLTTSHFLSTVDLELLATAGASLLLLRLLRTGNLKLWLPIGSIVGIGLLDKYTVALWVVAAVVGLAASGHRRVLLNSWALMAAVIAAALVAPSLVWQAQHRWAFWQFTQGLARNNAASDRVQFIPLQIGIVTVAGLFVWLAGVRQAWSGRDRWMAIGFALSAVILFVSGGKAYYLGDWYLALVALGATRMATRSPRRCRRMVIAVIATGLISLPIFTPVLPASTTTALGLDKANGDIGAMLGWRHIAAQIAAVYHALPAGEQPGAVIMTGDYSEAGAVDFYSATLHTPHAISDHNTYWLWGYGHPRPDAVTIAVGVDSVSLERAWRTVRPVLTLGRDGTAIDPQEQGTVVFLCRDQREPWAQLWPSLRHYD